MGERIEQIHETADEAKAALYELQAPLRAEQEYFDRVLEEWED